MISLKQIRIEAFRGIPGTLTVDLSAPITLIYAPNGSGKTTVCEAAEWLFTSRIKRLEAGGASAADLRCDFSHADQETKVSGTFDVDGEQILIERTLNGCQWAIGEQPFRGVTLTELLSKLAPSATEAGVHHTHANNSRQIWLRGTRFLSGDLLAALLDPDEASVGNRERIFADLLGVGHLLETERQLDAYLGTIHQFLRQQQTLFDDRSNSLRDLQSRTDLQIDADHQSFLPSAIERLSSAQQRLASEGDISVLGNLVPDNGNLTVADVRRVITVLRGEHERQQDTWGRKRQAEICLAADWSARYAIEQQQADDQTRLSALTKLISENTSRTNTLAREVAVVDQRLKQARQQITDARDRIQKTDGAFLYAQPLLNTYLALAAQSQLSAQDAFQLVDNAGSETMRANTSNRLRSLRDELSTRQREALELPVLKEQRDRVRTQMTSGPDGQKTAQEIQTTTSQLANLRRQYERAAGPIEQLQRLAATVIDLLDHESACPVCRHDWMAVESLKQAMAAARSASPASLVATAERMQKAESHLRSLEEESNRHSANVAALESLEARIRAIETAYAAFVARAAEVGLDIGSEHIRAQAELLIARQNLIDGLRRIYDEAKAYDRLSLEPVSRENSIGDFVNSCKDGISKLLERLTSELALLEKERELKQSEITQLSSSRQGLETEKSGLQKRLENSALRLQTLRSAWGILARERPWTDELLDEVSTALRREHETLSEIDQLIVQAERLTEASLHFEEVQRLQRELAPIEDERNRLEQYAEAAESVQSAYREKRHKQVRKQMEDFVRVTSALFIRMQANEVYDQITEGDASAPLSWRALSEGLAMDPDRKFSQGQKQDFALSIFLARARGLGGTFFLDEPLAHLDDLNRVALLDVFRAVCLEQKSQLSFVLTTASKPVLRHMVEKFAQIGVIASGNIGVSQEGPTLRVLGLDGNPRTGISLVAPGRIEAAA